MATYEDNLPDTRTDKLNDALGTSGKLNHESGDVRNTGEGAFSRRLCSSSVTIATGTLRMAFWRAQRSGRVGSIKMFTAGTAAATVTTIKFGLWEADDAESTFTLVASTANDATLFAATNTAYTKAVATAYKRTRGKLYAAGALFVGTTAPVVVAAPVLLGPVDATSLAYVPSPISGIIGSLTDLPASFTLSTLTAGSANQAPYVELVP